MTAVTNILRDLKNLVVPHETTPPSVDGLYDGQLHFEESKNIWLWLAATTEWICFPCAVVLGTGDPNGAVTPQALGQSFLAQDTGNLYISTGLTNNDWLLTN